MALTKNDFIIILLLLILILGIYIAVEQGEHSGEQAFTEEQVQTLDSLITSICDPGTNFCNNDKRYSANEIEGGGEEVPVSEAKSNIEQYKALIAPLMNQDGYKMFKTRGWVISKKAIDSIFNDLTLNSLSMEIGYSDSLRLIVRGHKCDSTKITSSAQSRIYQVRTLCPNDCMRY